MKRLYLISLALLLALGASAQPLGERNFSKGWEFSKDSLAHSKSVDLPHDFSMERASETDNEEHIGPFSSLSPNGHGTGYALGGTGWYRNTFTVAGEDAGKNFTLQFGGSYMETEITVNGIVVANHYHGYTPFCVDITRALKPAGQENEVIVKVANNGRNSRWYSGSGLYREVFLVVSEPVHIGDWGVSITTPEITRSNARVDIAVTADNSSKKRAKALLSISITDRDGVLVASGKYPLKLDAASSSESVHSLDIPDPKLWSASSPYLYTSEVQILTSKGKVLDAYSQKFGVRSIECDAVNGLRINGEPVLLKGGCVHHDNGLLGGAAYRAAEYRRVRLLKESGYNAVRCAHNPPSRYFLDACDELGMYVIDEFTDMWEQPKNADDYSRFFVDNWEKDITDMLLSDRNHPSVIMWSIGNEVPNWSIADASRIGKSLSDKVREIDPTRLVTQGITGAYIHLEWDNSQYTFQHLDVAGYNYLRNHYEEDHAKFPDRVMVCTESYPNQSFGYWHDVETKPYVIGDFLWSAIDYLGEVSCGSARYVDAEQPQRGMPIFQNAMGPKEGQNPAMMWAGGGGNAGLAGMPRFAGPKMPTSYVSWCGDIDLAGNVKPQGRYRRVMWDVSPIEILVHEPIPAGKKESLNQWGWPREQAQWFWPGNEGEALQVRVFAKAAEVRLEVNGEVIDTAQVNDEYIATFDAVTYNPGEIVAVALDGRGNEISRKSLLTPGKPYAVRIFREPGNDGDELAFLKLEVVDSIGNVIPGEFPLDIDIKGAKFVASGNGAIDGMESFGSLAPKTHLGSALLIIAPEGTGSRAEINVSSEGLKTGIAIL